MLLKTLKRAGSGFVLGMAAGNVIAALTGHPDIVSAELLQKAGSLSAALLWQTLLSGLIGAAGMGGTTLYELERWPLLAIDLAHYALIMAVFLPAGQFLGWFPTRGVAAVMAAIMFAVHFTIFLIMCAFYRAQVRELNQMQRQFLAEHPIQGGIV
jgi:hypothetical protein